MKQATVFLLKLLRKCPNAPGVTLIPEQGKLNLTYFVQIL